MAAYASSAVRCRKTSSVSSPLSCALALVSAHTLCAVAPAAAQPRSSPCQWWWLARTAVSDSSQQWSAASGDGDSQPTRETVKTCRWASSPAGASSIVGSGRVLQLRPRRWLHLAIRRILLTLTAAAAGRHPSRIDRAPHQAVWTIYDELAVVRGPSPSSRPFSVTQCLPPTLRLATSSPAWRDALADAATGGGPPTPYTPTALDRCTPLDCTPC